VNANFAALLYLVAACSSSCAARLSSPATSRQGNRYGMIGMASRCSPRWRCDRLRAARPGCWSCSDSPLAEASALARAHGADDAMPQLVAMFHSLVGLAAVLVAAGALYAPDAFGIAENGAIHPASTIEMSLGLAIGALTFTLNHRLPQARRAHVGRADHAAQRHALNMALAPAWSC